MDTQKVTEIALICNKLRQLMVNDKDVYYAACYFLFEQLGVDESEIIPIQTGNIIEMNCDRNDLPNINEVSPYLIKMIEILQNKTPELIPFFKDLLIRPQYRKAVLDDWIALKTSTTNLKAQ